MCCVVDLFWDSRTFFTSLDTDICTKICDICEHHKNTASWHKNQIWEKRVCFGFVGSIRDSRTTWGFTVRNWNLQHLQSASSWRRGSSWKHSPNPCFRNKHNELLTSLLPAGIKKKFKIREKTFVSLVAEILVFWTMNY